MNSKFFRYSIGFVLFFLILSAFYISPLALFIVSTFFIIIAMIEYRNLFKEKEIYPHPIIPEFIGILSAFIFTITDDIETQTMITPVLLFGIILTFTTTVIRNKKPYIATSLCTIAAFLLIFCGLYIIKLTYFFNSTHAWYVILIYFFAVLAGDFSASRIGPKFKSLLLSPEISPNKTVAGSVANLIITCLICTLFTKFLFFALWQSILLGIVISTFAQIGDLTISTFKRDIGVKHSGTLFYEYGGILDRMDAFIFSAPTAYYMLYLIA